jgi:phosphoenolpyruvate-protein kinase (PTS system EI component)
MKTHNTNVLGSPYFPGVVVGKLHRGMNGHVSGHIILVREDEVALITTLPTGLIVVDAAPFSHTMIGLLGLGVPTVLISEQQAELFEEGMELQVDGSSGRITDQLDVASPETEYTSARQPGQAVLMADGNPVSLAASVRQPAAARKAKQLAAKNIGLVRSEYLLPEHDLIPDAAFYQSAFLEICEAASPLTVTFRLQDIAGDKIPPWLSSLDTPGKSFGMQGVRLFGLEAVQRVIDAQLDALAELSNDFSLRVLIPFLTRLEEYEYWLSLIRKRLPGLPVGAMAETPASVLDIGHMLESADFVAIGCNDLMQNLYAADRDLPELRHYLDPYAPVLYRFLKQAAEQASAQVELIQLCGVLSQIQGVLPVLLGLGYRTFSVDAPFIPYLASVIEGTTSIECESLAEEVCTATLTQQVLEILGLPTDRHPPFSVPDKTVN